MNRGPAAEPVDFAELDQASLGHVAARHRPHERLKPSRGWVSLRLRELWAYRELVYFLVWRDIKVRYKQTVLGAAWAVLQPVATMIVFSIFFGRLAGMPSDGLPYPLFNYAALVPWTFFANGLSQSALSLVGSSNLIKKVYFPRLAIPLSAVCGGSVDFAMALLVLFIMQAYYGVYPSANVLWLPVFILMAFMTSLGTGLWLSALNVRYRDVKYTLTFLVQFWMFATPIAYPSSLVQEKWRWLFGLNPMAGVVESFRWALLDTKTQPDRMILLSFFVASCILAGGLFYFRQVEKSFADLA